MLFNNIINCSWIFSCISELHFSLPKDILDIASDPFFQNVNIILLTETHVLHNQELNMQIQFENHYLVMHNDHTGCFKSLAFLKKAYLTFHSAV